MQRVIIVGGGIVGYSTGLALKEAAPELSVTVLERDVSYRTAATGKGTGGIRQLFTRPENIQLSQDTLDVVEAWESWAAVANHDTPDLQYQANGYLFIAGPADVDQLRANYEIQTHHGVDVHWLTPQELADQFPEIRTTDLAGAVLSPRDGWLNPHAFFTGVGRKAHAAGVELVKQEVTHILHDDTQVTGVELANGSVLTADVVINTAGTRAPELARQLDIQLPVEPMRRHEHYAVADRDLDHLPFIKDIAGLAIHAQDGGVSVGLVDFDHPSGEDFSIDPSYYPKVVGPAVSHRLSGAQLFQEQRTWTGLYDQNRFDGNAIIGNDSQRFTNFYFAAGFSGHGFMHALGVGKALAEHITTGSYQTIDLTRLGYQRIVDNTPYPELGIR